MPNDIVQEAEQKRGRGRPRGSSSATLAEVRAQALKEKRQLQTEFTQKIESLEQKLLQLEAAYTDEVEELRSQLKKTRKRESAYREALDQKLREVADHIHDTLLQWGRAELEEGSIYKRGRGRPRKTLKN